MRRVEIPCRVRAIQATWRYRAGQLGTYRNEEPGPPQFEEFVLCAGRLIARAARPIRLAAELTNLAASENGKLCSHIDVIRRTNELGIQIEIMIDSFVDRCFVVDFSSRNPN